MKEFTGQLVDNKGEQLEERNLTLVEIAELFKIPIDENRIEDYTLSNVNYVVPSVMVVDKAKGITYRSIMSDHSSILGFTAGSELKSQINQLSDKLTGLKSQINQLSDKLTGRVEGDKVFVTVTTTDSEYTELTEEYALCYRIPFASRIDSCYESDKLRIVKLDRNLLRLPIEGDKLTEMAYIKDFFGKKEKSTLSRKLASTGISYTRTFEKGSISYKNERSEEVIKSRFSHKIEGNVYYGMNETMPSQGKTLFSCVCFENAQKHGELWPSDLKAEQYIELEMLDTLSALIFNGFDNDIKHSLTIYKKSDTFDISYAVGTPGKDGVHVKKLQVPIIQRGKVTQEEVDSLVEALCTILDDEFGVKVIVELKEFQRRSCPITEYIITPLRRLSFMSPKEIFTEISENREQQFQALDVESQDFKSIGGILSQGRQMTLLPKKDKK